MILFKNVKVIQESCIIDSDVLVNGSKIEEIGTNLFCEGAEIIDGKGFYLSAGFIDLHVHGGGGFSAMGGKDEILGMAEAHAKFGTTSMLPTALSAGLDTLEKVTQSVIEAQKENRNILGVHLEGPFLSPNMNGAQKSDSIFIPRNTDYDGFINKYKDTIKMMGVAPELDGAFALGEKLKNNGAVASIAHSSADYDISVEALKHGFSDVTHIYNACTSCFKKGAFRYAGTVEAGLANDEFTVQVIADLKHLPLGVLKLIYKAKGADKMYLITDGLEFSASEIEDGTKIMQKNGVEALYEDGVMLLADRSKLAGSASNSIDLVRNMYKKVGVPLTDAVKMMTVTPAKVIGVDSFKGKIEKGYDADIILFDDELNLKSVMISGEIFNKTKNKI